MEAEVTSKDEVVAQIAAEWSELDALLAPLDEPALSAPLLADGQSVKDTLAHIMSWEQTLIQWVGELVAGEAPQRPFSGDDWIDRVNEQVFNHYREVPAEEVLDAFSRSHREVVEMVEALPAAALFEADRFSWLQGAPLWRMVAANTWWHYREHREALAAALA